VYEITSGPERLSWQKRYKGAAHCTYQPTTPGNNDHRHPQREERTTPEVPLQLQVIAVKAFVVGNCIGYVLAVCGFVSYASYHYTALAVITLITLMM
jgi:hypothetical protein